jgi:hypothetical protein
VVDRRLEGILETLRLDEPDDLWGLLPAGLTDSAPFTTRDLARKMDVPLPFAQRVAYCLRLSGAARTVGKVGNCHLYKAGTSFCQIPERPGSGGGEGCKGSKGQNSGLGTASGPTRAAGAAACDVAPSGRPPL